MRTLILLLKQNFDLDFGLLGATVFTNRSSFESLSEELKDKCVITKHNIDEEPNIPTKYGVREFLRCFYLKIMNLKYKSRSHDKIKYKILD